MTDEELDRVLDLLQLAANNGAFVCPLAGESDKPDQHEWACAACRARAILTPRWYVAPEIEMRVRLFRHAENHGICEERG